MNMIIWGTGDWGAYAYWNYAEENHILFFVDSDKEKQGSVMKYLGGLEVKAPEEICRHKDAKTIIGVKNSDGIKKRLLEWGISDAITVEDFQKKHVKEYERLYSERAIDLGDFLNRAGKVSFYQTFLIGASGTLDYALITGIVKKFRGKKYMEIGTYIGESIRSVSDLCDECHSVTAPLDSEYAMSAFCKKMNIPDYSERLTGKNNIIHHYTDSKEFDFSKIAPEIDVFFVDADHTFNGVYHDTRNIFQNKKKDAFVIWHDFRPVDFSNGGTALSAIKLAIGEREFNNLYVVDHNICAIYIPERFQSEFKMSRTGWTPEAQDLFYYRIELDALVDRA